MTSLRKSASKLLALLIIAAAPLFLCACADVGLTYRINRDGTFTQIIDARVISDTTGYSKSQAFDKLKEVFEGEGYTIQLFDDEPYRIRAVKFFASANELSKDAFGSGLMLADSESGDGTFWYNNAEADYYVKVSMVDRTENLKRLSQKYGIGTEVTIFDLLALSFSYNYVTPYKSVTSNAQEVTESGGYYTHSWSLSRNDTQIVLYSSTPKRQNWYAVAIAAGLAAAGISAAAIAVKRARDKVDGATAQ